MIIFDNLDNLETYLPYNKKIQKIIDILDIGDIYDEKNGNYSYKEDNTVQYTIETTLTSAKGFLKKNPDNVTVIEIVLNGEELISFNDSSKVFRMAPGRFILTDEEYKKGMLTSTPDLVKTVRFVF